MDLYNFYIYELLLLWKKNADPSCIISPVELCQAVRVYSGTVNITIRDCAFSLYNASLHANRPARIHLYHDRNKNTFPRERWKLSGKSRPL